MREKKKIEPIYALAIYVYCGIFVIDVNFTSLYSGRADRWVEPLLESIFVTYFFKLLPIL